MDQITAPTPSDSLYDALIAWVNYHAEQAARNAEEVAKIVARLRELQEATP